MTEPEPIREAIERLMLDLSEHIKTEEEKPPMRTFPKDTRLDDLPDDLTPDESYAIFGTPYDKSTLRLKSILEMLGQGHVFQQILDHVPHVTMPVFEIQGSQTVEEAMPMGVIIDLVTIGLLTHNILSNVDIDGMGVIKMSDLLNGKGPFGG